MTRLWSSHPGVGTSTQHWAVFFHIRKTLNVVNMSWTSWHIMMGQLTPFKHFSGIENRNASEFDSFQTKYILQESSNFVSRELCVQGLFMLHESFYHRKKTVFEKLDVGYAWLQVRCCLLHPIYPSFRALRVAEINFFLIFILRKERVKVERISWTISANRLFCQLNCHFKNNSVMKLGKACRTRSLGCISVN